MAEVTAAARALGHVVDGVDSDVQWARAVGLLRGMDACGVARVWVRLVSENASLVRCAQCRVVFDEALADGRSVRRGYGGVAQEDEDRGSSLYGGSLHWSDVSSLPSPRNRNPQQRPQTAPAVSHYEITYLPPRPQTARRPGELPGPYNERLRGEGTPVSDTMSATIHRPLPQPHTIEMIPQENIPRPSTAPPARTVIPPDWPVVHGLEPPQPAAGTGWNWHQLFFNRWPFTGPPPQTDHHVPDGRAPVEPPPRRRRPHTTRPSRQA